MIHGLSGSLLSHDALAGMPRRAAVPGHRWFYTWHQQIVRDMGPTSSAREIYDRIALPLTTALNLRIRPAASVPTSANIHALLYASRTPVCAVVVTPWGADAASSWRETVRTAIGHGVKWALCMTGPVIRIYDASQTYARRFAEFDLEMTTQDPATVDLFCALLGAGGFNDTDTALDRAVILSEQHRAAVRTSLQQGVHDAVLSLLQAFAGAHRRSRAIPLDELFDESLVVIYRILFLLFAEARALVPKWHPVYRDSYTIESLRESTERERKPAGLWESIQAIARLAHHGCRAGTLRVPPFNGRLFSPLHAPLADAVSLDDGAVREAILSLTTRRQGTIRRPIAYADLGVEQLGGVYERILDYAPARSADRPRSLTLRPVGRRKATGTFYTPRALTEFMVRRALAPLVRDASSEQILALRIVDPAMGSGAFLVAACRYLSAAYESALIREGALSATDIEDADRARFRRVIAVRCLFGVDINPMAVQLARLSLWLATLARDKPLTFLDHHLRVGNSLVGASIEDVLRRPQSHKRPAAQREQLPLFDLDQLDRDVRMIVGTRTSLALGADDTIEQVRTKERVLASLQRADAPLSRWQRVANLWCAEWFGFAGKPRAGKAFGPLVDDILGRGSVLPANMAKPILDGAQTIADRSRFLHWPLEFPEVFHDVNGSRPVAPGFDAVIGNPPWEVLRGERQSTDDTALISFSRRSGIYRWQSEGHANLYQLFLERALSLVRTGGRIAMVLPSGFASDHGCARLRSALMDRTGMDTFATVENRNALFPIHRALKFLLVTGTLGERTDTIPCRSGIQSAADLERIPEAGDDHAIGLARSVIEKFSGDQLAIPLIATRQDAEILGRTVFRFEAIASLEGWGVRFGRELNATDDRPHFLAHPSRGHLPILEGKQIQPFVANVDRARQCIAEGTAARLLGSTAFRRPRLAYRDVASASNRLTLIAAIIPANVVTTHTLFCLKTEVPATVQLFLCGVLNSFVANYFVRMRVGTHVTVSIIERLPVPCPAIQSDEFREVVALTSRVVTTPTDHEAAAQLQACVARIYQMERADFQRVLDTFPLVPTDERQAAMACFMAHR